MTATRVRTLLAVAAVAAVLGYVLTELIYFDLPPLPALAPLSLAVVAVAELGVAKAVRDWVAGTYRGRSVSALQVARAVVLAKASSLAGSVLLGLYAGAFAWTIARKESLATAGPDALVAGLSAGAALLVVVSALVLERSCRTPRVDE